LKQWGLISCRFCLALCRPLQLKLLSAEGRALSNTAKTADFFILSYVYNQFLCSLTCTNNQFFSRTLEYFAVFIIQGLPRLSCCHLSKAYLTRALPWLPVQRWRRNRQISLPSRSLSILLEYNLFVLLGFLVCLLELIFVIVFSGYTVFQL
jgi:hypothetical protein